MISERMDHPSFDDKRTGIAMDQSHTRKLPIDTLPTELLERVIRVGATKYHWRGSEIEWICEWRRVSRKWASVIDHCPALWSYIVISKHAGHVQTQLAKSKGAPLNILLWSLPTPPNEEWIRLLADNVHRWKSIEFFVNWEEVFAVLDSTPPMLEALRIYDIDIPPDSKFLYSSSPNLRVLELRGLTIPSNIQPVFGLEELCLMNIHETLEDGTVKFLSARKLHQFLQASPGLQVLKLDEHLSVSAADKSLQPVDLPNLKELKARGTVALHLFRAGHCDSLTLYVSLVKQKLPPVAWPTVIPTLRRAKGLAVEISKYFVEISSLLERPTIQLVRLSMELEGRDADLSYAILEEILQELEYESCISARIQLSFDADDGIGVKVLKLLQSPMPGPSSRWRLPHLDTVCIKGKGFPYQYLQAFVQARANAQGDQVPKAVTSILEKHGSEDKEILGEFTDYAGDEGVAEGAVVQAE